MSVSNILKFVLPFVVCVQGVNFKGGLLKRRQRASLPSARLVEKHFKCQQQINEMIEGEKKKRWARYGRVRSEKHFVELVDKHYQDGTIKQFLPYPSDVQDIVEAVASDLEVLDRVGDSEDFQLYPLSEYAKFSELKKDCRVLKQNLKVLVAELPEESMVLFLENFRYELEVRHGKALVLQREAVYSEYKEMEKFLVKMSMKNRGSDSDEEPACEWQPLENIDSPLSAKWTKRLNEAERRIGSGPVFVAHHSQGRRFPTVESFVRSEGARSIKRCFAIEQARLLTKSIQESA